MARTLSVASPLALNKRALDSSRMPGAAQNSLYSFVAEQLSPHCNPVTCVLHGRDRPLIVSGGGRRIEADVVLIRPGVEHSVDIGGAARVLYLNGVDFPSNSDVADPLCGSLEGLAMAALDNDADAQAELRAQLSRRQDDHPAPLAALLAEISADPMSRMTQYDLANRLAMERTRALRYFKSKTGMTFRNFKQWVGLQAATRRIADGELVRTAAMDGGFADTAHLTRTFRTFFGTTPTLATADKR